METYDCKRCHATCDTDEGCEPTLFCHHCAQVLVDELGAALRELHDIQNGPPLETWREQWQGAMTKAETLLTLTEK